MDNIVKRNLQKLKEEQQEELEKLLNSNITHLSAIHRNEKELEKIRENIKIIDKGLEFVEKEI